MSKGVGTVQGDLIDPEIRRFVDTVNASYGAHADVDFSDLAERRRVAELVREPWRTGGPKMAESRDMVVDGFRMRLHRPTHATSLPVLLYIHGGGWTLFSIDTHDRLMREYAARSGIAVIGIDYSLSPEHKYPVALEQCVAAIGWLTENAESIGVDGKRILIGGDSAGANLSVATCLVQRDRGGPQPRCMVLNYGAFAPERTQSYDRFVGDGHSLEEEEMNAFWDNYVDRPEQLTDPLVSPLRADLSGLPPAFIAIAECDILADCNEAFAERLSAAQVPVEAVIYRGATHSFLEAVSIAPLAERALDDQAAWINKVLAETGVHAQ